jgi:hypothetical protein
MRKIVIFTLVSFILSSCSIEKRLAKYCPLCPTETERVVEYRDTTITVEVPGETVTVVDSLYCDSLGNVYSTRILERDSQILSLRTRLQNNRYTIDCESDTVYVDKLIKGNDSKGKGSIQALVDGSTVMDRCYIYHHLSRCCNIKIL